MRREFRVTLKKDVFYFRIIEGRKKIFERFYKKEDVKTIMSARIKGEMEFYFEGLTEEEKEAAKKTLREHLIENKNKLEIK